jgi:hypothetical protein
VGKLQIQKYRAGQREEVSVGEFANPGQVINGLLAIFDDLDRIGYFRALESILEQKHIFISVIDV